MKSQNPKRSLIRQHFDISLRDIDTLITLFDQLTIDQSGRPDIKLEVLKRAAIILLVTAFESFIEQAVVSAFERKLDEAHQPNDMLPTFDSLAESWTSRLSSRRIKPRELAQFAGNGWKTLLLEMCREEVRAFNSPKFGNIDRLFRKYLSVTAEEILKPPGYNRVWVRTNLDILISYRGHLVHEGKLALSPSRGVPRSKVLKSRNFVCGCVDSIQKHLHL